MVLWPAVAAAAGCDLTTADRVVLVDEAGDHELWVATTGGADGLPTAFVRVWGTRPDARATTGDVTWSDTSEHLLGARGGLVDSVLDSTAFRARRGDCTFMPSVAITIDPKDGKALWAAALRDVPRVAPPASGPIRLDVPRYRWTWDPTLGLFTTDGTNDLQMQQLAPECLLGGVPGGVRGP